jgi:arylsulfatase A-like enzyme
MLLRLLHPARNHLCAVAAVAVATAFALTAALLFACTGCATPGQPPAHNLLLITLDTTRADALSCNGHPRPTTPQLDSLATAPGSTLFDFAIAQAAVTPVSHASIFTGLDPHHHGLRVLHGLRNNRLEAEQTTLAEIWRRAGGETGAFVSAYPTTAAFGLDQGFDHFDADFPGADGSGLVSKNGVVNTGSAQRGARETTDAAISWLRKAAPRADRHPIFTWVHYFDPHDTTVIPPQEELHALLNGPFRPRGRARADMLRAVYECETNYMDRHIGRLFAAWRDLGLADNTVVVVVADHGEGLGDHGWWSHGILYQEQIRVPLLLHLPGVESAPRVSSLVRTTDILPTLLDACAIAPGLRPAVDGLSLLPAMQSGATAEPRSAYSESVNLLTYGRPDDAAQIDAKDDKLYSLIHADGRKLIFHQLRPEKSQLYDLRTDPRERHNLAAEQTAELEAMITELRSMNALSEIMPGQTQSDPEHLKKLRSLGYVE